MNHYFLRPILSRIILEFFSRMKLKNDTKYLQEIEKLIKMKIKILNINKEKSKLKDYEFDTLYESNQIPNFLKR